MGGSYSFGFTGFKWMVAQQIEEPEPFDEFVHEVRVEAGLEEPRPIKQPYDPIGQILWSGQITFKAPQQHKQLRKIK